MGRVVMAIGDVGRLFISFDSENRVFQDKDMRWFLSYI